MVMTRARSCFGGYFHAVHSLQPKVTIIFYFFVHLSSKVHTIITKFIHFIKRHVRSAVTKKILQKSEEKKVGETYPVIVVPGQFLDPPGYGLGRPGRRQGIGRIPGEVGRVLGSGLEVVYVAASAEVVHVLDQAPDIRYVGRRRQGWRSRGHLVPRVQRHLSI